VTIIEEPASPKSIDELLTDLNDPDPTRRVDVIKFLVASGIKDERILNQLRLIANGDPDPGVRDAARNAMRSLGSNAGVSDAKKDFWRGVGLFFGLNIVMALCSWGASVVLTNMTYTANGPNEQLVNVYPVASFLLGLIPLLINIGLIVYFAFTRRQIALGMLTGFGIALIISIILGVIFAVACIIMLRSAGY
jgi:hypothetical protein